MHQVERMLDIIAFDADDTLWHNEILYREAKAQFQNLLARYQSPEQVAQRLDEIEIHNVAWYGYGIKSFTLSMVETAVEVSNGQVSGDEIQVILAFGKRMHSAEVQLFERAQDILAQLAQEHALMLITKGELLEQSRKLEKSGLAHYFRHIEIVQDKTAASYHSLLEKYALRPDRFLMVGNSLKSDILPVIEIGGQAVYIPFEHTWAHEVVAVEGSQQTTYFEIEHIGELPALVARLDQGDGNPKSQK